MGRLVNIIFGLALILFFTNKLVNLVQINLSTVIISIILIGMGLVSILFSISFERKHTIPEPGVSKETKSTKVKGTNIFLGLLSIALGISHLVLKTLELPLSIGGIILGVFFVILKSKKVKN